MRRRLTSLFVIITLMGSLAPLPVPPAAAQLTAIPVTWSVSGTILGTSSGLRTTQEAAVLMAAVLLLALGPLPANATVVSGLVCDTNGNARFGELADRASGVASILSDGQRILVRVKVSGLPPQTPMACRLTCAHPGADLRLSPCGTTTMDGKLTGTAQFSLESGLPGGCVAPGLLVHKESEPRAVCVSGVGAPMVGPP